MKKKIVVRKLTKTFGDKVVLNSIDVDIFEGESIVVLGGSGTGKTVFIKLLSSLIPATSGSIKVDNREIVGISGKEKGEYIKKIGFLFQLNALFDSFPIWKNITIEKTENEGMKKTEAIEFAERSLEQVSLEKEVALMFPKDISGGMQKRVALARCLASRPEIIFFDEPTSGLDPLTSLTISRLIRNTQNLNGSKLTKISIMHDVECAKIVADRILFFSNGQIEWEGTPTEMETTKNLLLRKFLNRV
jgi:phospholipid/cholesterol/gamma-HCH transport system ATP-binding protein